MDVKVEVLVVVIVDVDVAVPLEEAGVVTTWPTRPPTSNAIITALTVTKEFRMKKESENRYLTRVEAFSRIIIICIIMLRNLVR